MHPTPQAERPDSLTIPGRFNGPLTSGNGGWTAGALAQRLLGSAAGAGAVASVALRAPVPLDAALALQALPQGGLGLLSADGQVVADVQPAGEQDLAGSRPPAVPDLQAAADAGALGRLRNRQRPAESAYARCFVCGFARHDGLQLAPGPVGDAAGTVATLWVPAPDLADPGGTAVGVATLWAALDCPAGMAWGEQLPPGAAMVTVRMTVAIDAPVLTGARYRVLAWPLAREGRKLHAGSALVDDAGTVCARSRQLWLMPRDGA